MTQTKIARSLPRRILRRHSSLTLMFISLAFLATFICTGLSTFGSSAKTAVEEGTRAGQLGHEYTLSPRSAEVARALDKSSLDRFSTVEAEAKSTTGVIPITFIRSSKLATSPLVLSEGRNPANPNEGVVSLYLAKAIDISIGDYVQFVIPNEKTTSLRIVGVGFDPRDRKSLLAASTGHVGEATGYAYDGSALPGRLGEYFQEGTLRQGSVASTSATQISNLPTVVGSSSQLLPGVIVAWAMAVLLVVLAQRRTALDIVQSLLQAGMPRARAWRTIGICGSVPLFIGFTLGAAASAIVQFVYSDSVAKILGQKWATVSGLELGIAASAMAVIIIPAFAFAALHLWTKGGNVRTLTPLVVTAAVVLLTMRWLAAGTPLIRTILACAFAGIIAIAVQKLSIRGLPPVSRVFSERATREFRLVAIVATVVACFGSSLASDMIASTNLTRNAYVASQPPGSLLIDGVSKSGQSAAIRAFTKFNGRGFIAYELVEDGDRPVRATAPSLSRCMQQRHAARPEEVLDTCDPGSAAPVNVLAFSSQVSSASGDALLVEHDRVSLIGPKSTATDVWINRGSLTAKADDRLGGRLPAVLLPPADRQVKKLDLRGSGTYGVALLGANELLPQEQASLLATVSSVSAGADYFLDRGFSDDGNVAFSWVAGLVSAVAALLILFVGWRAQREGSAQNARVLIEIGSRKRSDRLRIFQAPMMSGGMAVILGTVVGRLASQSHSFNYGHGVAWALPLLAGIIFLIAAGRIGKSVVTR